MGGFCQIPAVVGSGKCWRPGSALSGHKAVEEGLSTVDDGLSAGHGSSHGEGHSHHGHGMEVLSHVQKNVVAMQNWYGALAYDMTMDERHEEAFARVAEGGKLSAFEAMRFTVFDHGGRIKKKRVPKPARPLSPSSEHDSGKPPSHDVPPASHESEEEPAAAKKKDAKAAKRRGPIMGAPPPKSRWTAARGDDKV